MTSSDKQFFVVGQRRSGTSLVSGILYHLGIDVGAEPDQTSERNPEGFFEDKEFADLSIEALNAVQNNPSMSLARLESEFGPKIDELVEKREGTWAVKDANQVHTHLVFKRHIPNPHYIFVFRNLLDTARSFADWGERDIMTALKVINDNNEMMWNLIGATEEPSLFVSYDDALRFPEKVVNNIAEFVGVEPTDEAVNHVKPKDHSYNIRHTA